MPSFKLATCFAAAIALATVGAVAQDKKPEPVKVGIKLGKPITEADMAPWNIDIRTNDGKGLPPGKGTVADGQKLYVQKCQVCHGENAKGGPMFGTMVGGIGSFTTKVRVLTPGSMYPYAPILFDYTRRAMPMDAPQSLTDDQVYALSAYILHLNGLWPENAVLDAEQMIKIQMPNRNGFLPDDRPDTKAARCLQNCPPIVGVQP